MIITRTEIKKKIPQLMRPTEVFCSVSDEPAAKCFVPLTKIRHGKWPGFETLLQSLRHKSSVLSYPIVLNNRYDYPTICLLVFISEQDLTMIRGERPTRCYSTVYWTYDSLNMFWAPICPSSGAGDYTVIHSLWHITLVMAGCRCGVWL